MTLLEVIVAFAIFAIAATILITGFGGALRVMGNSEAIKDASQKNASGLESPLENIENVKVDILSNSGLNYKLGDHQFKIKGSFIQATTPKSNDQTEMSMLLFETEQNTKPIPTPVPNPPEDKVPKVPVKQDKDAYWNPDPDLGSYDKTYFNEDGTLKSSNFNSWDQNGYLKKYGVLQKGVVNSQIKLSTNAQTVKSQYLQQLFFISEEPFVAKDNLDGHIIYNVNFIYFSGNKMEMNLFYNESSKTISSRTTSITLNSYSNDNSTTILYLAQEMAIKVYYYNDSSNQLYGIDIKKLPEGYYELPNGTDILKAAYNEIEYTKYTFPVSTDHPDSYQRTYNDLEEKLSERSVETEIKK